MSTLPLVQIWIMEQLIYKPVASIKISSYLKWILKYEKKQIRKKCEYFHSNRQSGAAKTNYFGQKKEKGKRREIKV